MSLPQANDFVPISFLLKFRSMPFVKTNFSIPLDELKRESSSKQEEVKSSTNFRPCCLKCRVFDNSRGSAYAEFGQTKVLARVYGPIEDPNGDFSEATLSLKTKGIPESVEIDSQVLSVIRACVMAHKYSQCSFEVEVNALNDDGGLLQCVLIAAILALADAEVLLLDTIVAAHVARTPSSEWIVDPTREQVASGYSECTVALMPNQNQIVCCDIRGGRITSSDVEELICFAADKAMKLYPVVRKALISTLPESDSC